MTRLLDTRAVYLVPRLNPDGSELALADRPRHIRSSTRPYPFDEEPVEGLTVEDVDGDGRILSMRIADPHGGWKPHPADARVMIPREPGEFGGTYYRILPEGSLQNYDGLRVTVNRDVEGLDLNRTAGRIDTLFSDKNVQHWSQLLQNADGASANALKLLSDLSTVRAEVEALVKDTRGIVSNFTVIELSERVREVGTAFVPTAYRGILLAQRWLSTIRV